MRTGLHSAVTPSGRPAPDRKPTNRETTGSENHGRLGGAAIRRFSCLALRTPVRLGLGAYACTGNFRWRGADGGEAGVVPR